MSQVQEFQASVKTLSKDFPEQVGAFMNFMNSVEGEGAVDGKTKHLTLVALAVANQCVACIGVHVAGAIKSGASRLEILEIAWLAVLMGGGPKLTYMKYVLQELEANGL